MTSSARFATIDLHPPDGTSSRRTVSARHNNQDDHQHKCEEEKADEDTIGSLRVWVCRWLISHLCVLPREHHLSVQISIVYNAPGACTWSVVVEPMLFRSQAM